MKKIIIILAIVIAMLFTLTLLSGIRIVQQQSQINSLVYVATQNADRVVIYSKYIYLQEKIIQSYRGEFFTNYDPDTIDFLVYSTIKEDKK